MKPLVKWSLISAGSVVSLAFVTIACLPVFFSSDFGKGKLLSLYQKKTGQNLEIDRLSFSWFSSQELEGIKITDSGGHEIFSCPKIQIESSLWKILIWGQDMGKVNIEAPKTNLIIPEGSPHQETSKKGRVFILPLKGNIIVDNGTLVIPGQEISFTDVSVNILVPSGYTPINVDIKGETTQQGQIGNFTINLVATDVFSSKRSIDVKSSLTHLPVNGIDALVSVVKPEMKGLLTEALGTTLDLKLTSNFAKDRLLVDLQLDSPNMHTIFTTQAKDDEVVLQAPSQLNFTATPAFFGKLSEFYPFLKRYSLQKPTQLTMMVSSFSFPLSPSIDLERLSLIATINMGQTNFVINDLKKDFSFDLVAIALSTKELKKNVEITSDITLAYQKTIGKVHFSSVLQNVFEKSEGMVSLKADNIPCDLIDPSLTTFLGNTLALEADSKVQNGAFDIKMSLQTPLLSIQGAELRIDEQKLAITAPFQMRYQITKEAFFFAANSPFMLAEVTFADIPFKTLDKTKLSAKLSVDELLFSSSLPLEKSSVSAMLDVNSFSNIAFSAQTKQLSIATQGSLLLKEKLFKCSKTDWALTLAPSEFTALTHLDGDLQTPVTLRGEISPFSFPLESKEIPSFDFTAKSSIDTMTLHNITLNKIALNLAFAAKTNKLSFQFDSQTKTGQEIGSLSLSGDVTPFNLKDPRDFKDAQVNMNLNCKNFATVLLSDLIKEPTLENAIGKTLNAQVTINSLGQDKIIDLLIKSANLQVEGSLKTVGSRLTVQKKPLCITAILNKDGYALLHKWLEPGSATIFALQGESSINLCLSDLSCTYTPLTQKMQDSKEPIIDWSSLNYKAKLDIDTLSFLSKQEESVFVKNVQLLSSKSIQDDRFYFQMQGTTGAKSPKLSQEGSFTVNGNLLSQQKGSWDPNALKTSVQVTFKQFPTILLDILTSNQESCFFSSLFGNSLSLIGETSLEKLSGPINFNLSSPNVRVAFAGDIRSGILSLKEPLIAQVQLTQNLSRCFLKETKISAIYSNNPVTISIDSKNLAFPIYPFDASKINIPNSRIELGQVFCENRGNAGTVLKILKSSSNNKTVKLWFAPLDMHIKNGIADIERTEILINDTFQIATWGQIDFPKDYVDMVIGLTASALQTAFGITKLPDDYVMKVPAKGPIGDVEINTSTATTKIAALLAWQHGEALAGKGGGIFGGFLGAIATLPDRDSNIPPPKRPFPWEGQVAPQKKQKQYKKKSKAIYKEDKPLKQLWKVIS